MKKLFVLLFIAFAVCVNAQTVTPRYGNNPSQNDNTYRQLTLTTTTVTPTSTLVSVVPKSSYYNLITIASTSLAPTFTMNVSKAYFGDKVDVIVLANSTGSRVATFSTNIIGNALSSFTALSTGATTVAIPASKKLYVGYFFDGAKFIETSRTVEP